MLRGIIKRIMKHKADARRKKIMNGIYMHLKMNDVSTFATTRECLQEGADAMVFSDGPTAVAVRSFA